MSADGEIIEEIGTHQRGVVSLLGGVFVISPSDPSELADAMIRNRAENK